MEVETERLLLRPFRPDDAEAHHRQVGSDPAVTWDGRARTPDETRERVDYYLGLWRERGYGPWVVLDKESGELLGHAGLQPLEETGEEQLGYYLGRAAWGRGIATEAAKPAIPFAFDELGLDHLVAIVRHENAASQRVLAKLGFAHDHDGDYDGANVQLWRLERPR